MNNIKHRHTGHQGSCPPSVTQELPAPLGSFCFGCRPAQAPRQAAARHCHCRSQSCAVPVTVYPIFPPSGTHKASDRLLGTLLMALEKGRCFQRHSCEQNKTNKQKTGPLFHTQLPGLEQFGDWPNQVTSKLQEDFDMVISFPASTILQ